MKKIATATLVAFISAATATGVVASSEPSSDPSLNSHLRGTYAFTNHQTCLNTDSSGFVSSGGLFHPVDPTASRVDASTSAGLYKFDGRGNVTYTSAFVSVGGAAFTGTGELTFAPFVSSGTTSASGRYKVTGGGQVTVTLTSIFVTSPSGNYSLDQLVLSGRLGLDNKTLQLAIPEPTVQTQTLSATVRKRICQRADVLTKRP